MSGYLKRPLPPEVIARIEERKASGFFIRAIEGDATPVPGATIDSLIAPDQDQTPNTRNRRTLFSPFDHYRRILVHCRKMCSRFYKNFYGNYD